jgi:hypothetical protein
MQRPFVPVLSALLGFLTLLVLAETARADRVDDLADQLHDSEDYKVRLSAALALAKTQDERAIPAFIAALRDPDKTVRGVAAASLAKVIDARTDEGLRERALEALERTSSQDKNTFVRRQAKKAYDTLKELSTASASPTVGGIFVHVGEMSSKAAGAKDIRGLMRTTALRTFKQNASTMMLEWPGGTPSKSQLRAQRVTGYHIDGTLNELTTSGGMVSCKVSMLLATFPEKSMFGFLNGGAKVQVRGSEREIASAKQDCVTAVVEDLVAKKIIPTIQSRSK